MKKLDCDKECGTWYYRLYTPSDSQYLDGDAYILYDESKKAVAGFTSLIEMKKYVETEVLN